VIPMTIATKVQMAVPAGTWLLAQTTLEPFVPGAVERLGVAGIIALAALWLVRYFMGQNEKKDARIEAITASNFAAIQQMHKEQIETHTGHVRMLVIELQAAHESRSALKASMDTLAREVLTLRDTVTTGRVRA
jgi:hypothetical protein